ncbi:MAG TPA: metal-dependent hydrolase [Acidiferrobacter sp.]|nr:metal-dependent hydrolase [Acidiferrobacter sp.]
MDVVHHMSIGGVGFVALAAQGQELAALGFLVGSVLPDLDVVFMAAGRRFYLKHHQGPTHSLLLAPFYAAALAALMAFQIGWIWVLFLGLLAGLVAHILLDVLNTFGIQLFWPLTKRRFCLDALFFVDTIAWTLTAGFFAVVITRLASPGVAAIGYAILLVSYGLAKFRLQRRVKARLNVDFAIPSAWNPFGFFLLVHHKGRLETSTYNALTDQVVNVQVIPDSSPAIIRLARQSPIFRDMESILRSLNITRVQTGPDGTTVVAQDLAVRNFGGRFGRTELHFDPEGRLRYEMAHI